MENDKLIFTLEIIPFVDQPQDRTTWLYHLGASFSGRAQIKMYDITAYCPTHKEPLNKAGVGKWQCWKCEHAYLDKDITIEQQAKTIESLKNKLRKIANEL